MESELSNVNWLAVFVGTIVAFALGMLWFSPKMFGKVWATGSHNIQRPKSPPLGAMAVELLGIFTLALVVGVTATTDALISAILAILAAAILMMGSGLFGQKTTTAALVDAGYIIAAGAIMIVAQGVF